MASREGGVWRIEIRRPEKRNALNGPMFAALGECLRLGEADPAVRAIVVHGSQNAFCAGHDVREFGVLWPQSPTGAVVRCLEALASQAKPLVAAVTGPAVGFGATLLLHCDHVVADESAIIQFPFANLGIVPEAGCTALLGRRVGDLRAREWLLTGRVITAGEAMQHGLVSRAVPSADVIPRALAFADEVAAKPQGTPTLIRRLLRESALDSAAGAIRREIDALNTLIPAARFLAPPA